MAINQQSRNGASPSTRPDAMLIPIAATVSSGRGGRTQEEAEPCDRTCVHHQVRRTGYLGSQTAPQTDREHDLGHSHEHNNDSTCPIALEQRQSKPTNIADDLVAPIATEQSVATPGCTVNCYSDDRCTGRRSQRTAGFGRLT
jgi:hypothetical protein